MVKTATVGGHHANSTEVDVQPISRPSVASTSKENERSASPSSQLRWTSTVVAPFVSRKSPKSMPKPVPGTTTKYPIRVSGWDLRHQTRPLNRSGKGIAERPSIGLDVVKRKDFGNGFAIVGNGVVKGSLWRCIHRSDLPQRFRRRKTRAILQWHRWPPMRCSNRLRFRSVHPLHARYSRRSPER